MLATMFQFTVHFQKLVAIHPFKALFRLKHRILIWLTLDWAIACCNSPAILLKICGCAWDHYPHVPVWSKISLSDRWLHIRLQNTLAYRGVSGGLYDWKTPSSCCCKASHNHNPSITVLDSWYEVFVLICCLVFSKLGANFGFKGICSRSLVVSSNATLQT